MREEQRRMEEPRGVGWRSNEVARLSEGEDRCGILRGRKLGSSLVAVYHDKSKSSPVKLRTALEVQYAEMDRGELQRRGHWLRNGFEKGRHGRSTEVGHAR